MATENDFNAKVTDAIRKMGTSYKAMKVSDRFKSGCADWLIFHCGLAVAVEAKYAQSLPKKGKVLKHPVTGPQRTFLKTMGAANIPGWVILGLADYRKIVAVPLSLLPPDGNWTRAEIDELLLNPYCYSFGEVPEMVKMMFNHAGLLAKPLLDRDFYGQCTA